MILKEFYLYKLSEGIFVFVSYYGFYLRWTCILEKGKFYFNYIYFAFDVDFDVVLLLKIECYVFFGFWLD